MIDELIRGSLTPFKHYGANNWHDADAVGALFRTHQIERPEGPVIGMTTGGFDGDSMAAMDRIQRFISHTVQVERSMRGVDGYLFSQVFSVNEAFHDPITFSVWRDEASLDQFAYSPGEHRQRLDEHRIVPFFDRGTFTRFVVERVEGSWGKAFPVASQSGAT